LVTKKGVSPETYPDDMKKALLKGFVLRVNQDILESVQKKSSEDSDDVESE